MLDDTSIATLQDLLRTCGAGRYGFRRCAVHVRGAELRAAFMSRAAEWATAATQLQRLVAEDDGNAGEHAAGARVAKAPRADPKGWSAVRGMMLGLDDRALLDECRHGERAAVARYRGALEKPLPAPVRSVLERQCALIQRSRKRLRKLCHPPRREQTA